VRTGRGLFFHFVLLAVAAFAAVFVWTRDKKAAVSATEVVVVSARAADLERVDLKAKVRNVLLEAKKDGAGRYFVGTSETTSFSGDAGSEKIATFISVGGGDKLADALAPLRAVREVGQVDDERAAEFGLKDPEGTLSYTVGGKEHRFALGSRIGNDRYVRDEQSAVVYVLKGDVTRDLEGGEAFLAERELHGFKDPDLVSVKILARGKTRSVLRRGPDSKRIWADPADPEKADETVSNWFAKIDRLRPSVYLGQEVTPELIVRLDYSVKGTDGVFLELGKLPPTSTGAKPDYMVRTERTRRWAKVDTTLAEQIEQDLDGPSLLH
jgi:Domain of unknown function (DUF4340)